MDPDTQAQLKERFDQLPEVVRNAITSADVQKELRAVADTHKLHVDQWAKLENEVMLTLLAFQDPANLPKNIQSEVGVTAEEAALLAGDINRIVFEPIREELERQLAHPEAKATAITSTEASRQQILAGEHASAATPAVPASAPPIPGVIAATPPPAPPTEKAVRAPISSSYSARQASTERKNVEGDPYREMPL